MLDTVDRVHTVDRLSWKDMEFNIQIFQDLKVMESGLGPAKLWKINETVAAFLTCVHDFSFCIQLYTIIV